MLNALYRINLIKRSYRKIFDLYDKMQLSNTDFCIVSNNCWGYHVYKILNKPYNTPFVGLFILSEPYLKLISNIKYYLSQTVASYRYHTKGYPIIQLEDIDIHCLHYQTHEEALTKWNKRAQRFLEYANHDLSNVLFKMCDKELCDDLTLQNFLALPYQRKVFISHKQQNNVITVPNFIKVNHMLPNGDQLFLARYLYLNFAKLLK